MLIICTQDKSIRKMQSSRSAAEWGVCHRLTRGSVENADREFARHIRHVGSSEDLCLLAHGNDKEIGDEDEDGWYWTVSEVADMMTSAIPDYSGIMLVGTCGNDVTNFSARLALKLENAGACTGAWIFGYNTTTYADLPYPRQLHSPRSINNHSDLQCTRVGGGRSTRSRR